MTTNATKIATAKDYLALTKPRVTWLIVVTTAVGYFFGAERGPWHWATILRLAHTLTGTALLASATAVLNEWYERESDAKMRRTSRRPLPAGRIEPTYALIFGIVLAALGAAELLWAVNLRTTTIGSTTIAAYLFVYTPLKRYSPLSTIAAAFAGRYASADWVRGGKRKLERGSMGSRRDSFRVADSALARNRVDVS